jgi:hypothetical protein
VIEAAAGIPGVPYAVVIQAARIPVAYSKGTALQPAPRDPLAAMVR